MNSDTAVASASDNCKVVTVRRETDKQEARGRLQKLYARRGKKCCVHIKLCVCVCGNLYLYHHNLISAYLERKFKIDHHLDIVERQIDHWYLIKVDISRFRTDHSQCLRLNCFSPL